MRFIDLKTQYERYKDEIHQEMDAVFDSCRFIMGPAVSELEDALSAFTGSGHVIGCSSGSDAILLALMALDVRAGDEIIVPDFTFFATAGMVSLIGAVPVFADILPDTCTIDPQQVRSRITERTKGMIAVSLYGQCADFAELDRIAKDHGLFLLEDAAQSFGASYQGRSSCTLTEIATTSFYPAKPLGAYGDGGAVFTSNAATAGRIRSLLNHGQEGPYQHDQIGINGRLDTLQACVVKVKLAHFPEELEMRQQVAARYCEELGNTVITPRIRPGDRCSWAQYTVRHPQREKILRHLKTRGIPTAIHYPLPLHRQKPYAALGWDDRDFPNSVSASREVFSLPMHPFLTQEDIREVAAGIKEALL